jgi:hypothetical protein
MYIIYILVITNESLKSEQIKARDNIRGSTMIEPSGDEKRLKKKSEMV